MKRPILVLCALVFGLSCSGDGFARQGTSAGAHAQQTDSRLRTRDRYRREVERFLGDGKLSEAIAAAEKMLAIERELLAERHNGAQTEAVRRLTLDLVASLELLGQLHEASQFLREQPDFTEARRVRQEALELLEGLFPPGHAQRYRVTDARAALEDIARLGKLSMAERTQLQQAKLLNARVSQLSTAGRSREALAPAHKAVEIFRRLLGDEHPEHARSLTNLAALYHAAGAHSRAEPLYRQALEISSSALGRDHPDYISALGHLALLYDNMGDYRRAEPLCRELVQRSRKIFGRDNATYATSLNNLAALYHAVGDYGRAEPLYREASNIWAELVGTKHRLYAASCNNLGELYFEMGDYARAEPLLHRALQITRDAVGEEHPDYAVGLNNLAVLYYAAGDYARAEPLYREAARIWKKALGEDHPRYGAGLNNLAELYVAMGDEDRAEPLYRQASQIWRKSLGEKHPRYAVSLNNLAGLAKGKGDYADAERLYGRALEIEKDVFGEEHAEYARTLHNLGHLYLAMERPSEAEEAMRRSLEINLRLRDRAFAIQSERQRMRWTATTRHYLDHWTTLAAERDLLASPLYSAVLRWKGAVLERSVEDRLARRRPQLKPLVEELARVRTQWATMALRVPPPEQREAWNRQVRSLAERKERLEGELARKSALYRDARRIQALSPAALAARLPKGTVLIDFFVYSHRMRAQRPGGKPRSELRLLAFVLRAGHKLAVVRLGAVGPVARAVDDWRNSFGRDAAGRQAIEELARLIGQPLAPYLDGADTCLVAADGPLCRFPLGVLPGRRKGSYLVEDVAVGYVASGWQLFELLETDSDGPETEPEGEGLLMVGGIRYDALLKPDSGQQRGVLPAGWQSGGSRAVRLDRHLRDGFAFLPGTLLEAEGIGELFSKRFPSAPQRLLSGRHATERRLKQELTGRQWRYVHLATHGFFAPPEKISAWRPSSAENSGANSTADVFWRGGKRRRHDPFLLSGLVLAGAAREPEDSDGGSLFSGEGDGILTAAEVLDLDLNGTRLVVLSACDTGLGEVASGEGVLGLQRAFHAAGAQTMVTSLWRVNDAATSVLMEEFYRNLWQRHLPRLDALRQAQLFVLEHPERIEQRAAALRHRAAQLPVEDSERGLRLEPVGLGGTPGTPRRTGPSLWAGFVLSGDWR